MKKFNYVNAFIYTIGWIICVFGGSYGYKTLPIVITFFLVGGQLLYLRSQEEKVFIQDLILLFYAAFFGFLMEVTFLKMSFVSYATENRLSSMFPPGWLFCLYFLFALTFNHSLQFLNKRYIFPLIGGFVGGFLSYYAGFRIGAVWFLSKYSLIYISFFWAIYLTFIIFLNEKLRLITSKVYDAASLEKPLKVFFDMKCPICAKEVSQLKKRKQTGKVKYLSLDSEKDLLKYTDKFSYQSAMKKIHGIDFDGNILKGVDVFIQLYSRVDLQWLAVLLKAPGFNQVFTLGYLIWAKIRLLNR